MWSQRSPWWSVCVCARARARVCVCVCVCTHSNKLTISSFYTWISWAQRGYVICLRSITNISTWIQKSGVQVKHTMKVFLTNFCLMSLSWHTELTGIVHSMQVMPSDVQLNPRPRLWITQAPTSSLAKTHAYQESVASFPKSVLSRCTFSYNYIISLNSS